MGKNKTAVGIGTFFTIILTALVIIFCFTGEAEENTVISYNRLGIDEENEKVTISGGVWPGSCDPCNYVVGKYLREDATGVTIEIAEDGKALYGERYYKIENSGTDTGYDMNNYLYFRQRINEMGLETGKTYTLYAFVRGENLNTEKFKAEAVILTAEYCQYYSNDGKVKIGEANLNNSGITITENSFDWTIISITFSLADKDTLAGNTCICFTLSANNLGTISFDGIGLVEGNFAENISGLRENADYINYSGKYYENQLAELKEIYICRLRNYVKMYYQDTYDYKELSKYIANIKGATSTDKVKEYYSLYCSLLATGENQEISEPKSTSDSYCEAVALKDYEWHNLRFTNIVPGSIFASVPPNSICYGISTYEGSEKGVELIEGIDYEIDYEKGLIRRCPNTLILNAGETGTYEYEDGSYVLGETTDVNPNFRYYTFYISYSFDDNKCKSYEEVLKEINKNNGTCSPKKLINRLNKNNDEITYLVIGDSINTGAEAAEGFTFFDLFAEYITANYKNPVKIENYAVGGETCTGGLMQMVRAFEAGITPDVITIGFGMNDQNSPGMDIEEFDRYYKYMFNYVKEKWPKAQVILLTSIPACPIWNLTSGRDVEYAKEIVKMAKENKFPVADCNTLSHLEIEAGKHYAEVVTTGINHPGAYGHRLYYYSIASLFEVNKVNPLVIAIPAGAVICGGVIAYAFIKKRKSYKANSNIENKEEKEEKSDEKEN